MPDRKNSSKKIAAAPSELATDAELLGRRSARLRLRAAWMYYVEEMTQNAIGEALGIGRVTVVRLLSDARALHEVKITLSRDVAELPKLEIALQKVFDFQEAVVAPLSSPEADPTAPIGVATGQFISDFIRSDMKIGVGWGRTLIRSLAFIDEKPAANLSVVSLLGGITKARQYNPVEFAWQFSRLFQADCYLIPAPALVDSVETKRVLIERCGLADIFTLAEALDGVLVSVGGMALTETAHRYGFYSEEDRQSLIGAGAVGNLLYNFFDIEGRILDHPINSRVMSIPISTIKAAKHRIVTSGGVNKVNAILGVIRLFKPTVFITDEVTAAALLAKAGWVP